MAPFSFLQRGSLAERARQFSLASYTPSLTLEGLLTGIDNVRHDVFLSAKFCDHARQHIARLLAKYGGVEDLVKEAPAAQFRPPSIITSQPAPKSAEVADFKRLLRDGAYATLVSRLRSKLNEESLIFARTALPGSDEPPNPPEVAWPSTALTAWPLKFM